MSGEQRPIARDEFARLALRELDAVDRVARSLASSRADADDLVQETYFRALRGSDGFTLREFGVRPWLLRILHNVHLNNARRRKHEPTMMEHSALEAVSPESDALAPIPPFKGEFHDDELNAALDQLPTDLRAILILWAVDELTYKEMAHVLDIPLGTVMSRIHRARQKLYEILPKPRGPAGGNGNGAGRE